MLGVGEIIGAEIFIGDLVGDFVGDYVVGSMSKRSIFCGEAIGIYFKDPC
jgi:hypothetical protein